jgi:hypothetical protein
VRRIVDQASGNDYRFSELVQGIISSEQFRMRRAPEGGAAPESVAESTLD